MKKRRGSVSALLIIIIVLALLAATAYLGTAALAERKTAQGEALLQNGKFSEALEMFEAAKRYSGCLMRKDARITEGLAESVYGLEDYSAALGYYELLVKSDPENAKARYRLGLLYVREKDYNKAEEQVQVLREIHTYEAKDYADELSDMVREKTMKGIFQDLFDKFGPNLPKIPGLSDGFVMPKSEDAEDRKEAGSQEEAIPETRRNQRRMMPDDSDNSGESI